MVEFQLNHSLQVSSWYYTYIFHTCIRYVNYNHRNNLLEYMTKNCKLCINNNTNRNTKLGILDSLQLYSDEIYIFFTFCTKNQGDLHIKSIQFHSYIAREKSKNSAYNNNLSE